MTFRSWIVQHHVLRWLALVFVLAGTIIFVVHSFSATQDAQDVQIQQLQSEVSSLQNQHWWLLGLLVASLAALVTDLIMRKQDRNHAPRRKD